MKASLATAWLLATYLFVAPTHAQEQSTPPPGETPSASSIPPTPPSPVPNGVPIPPELAELQKSPLWQAYMAIINELKPLFAEEDIQTRLKQLDGFSFTAETKKKLFELFGNDDPLHFKFTKLPLGGAELSIDLDSLDHRNPETGSTAYTAAVSGKATYNKRFTEAHVVATMPSFSFDSGKTTTVTGTDLSFLSNQAAGSFGMWFGSGNFAMGQFSVNDSKADVHVSLSDLALNTDIKQRGKMIDVDYSIGIKTINWGSDEIGPVQMSFRIANIDGKAFAAIMAEAKKLDKTKQTDPEKVALLMSMVKDFGLATLAHGGAIDIRDISAQYHGHTARINGRVTFKNIQKSDFESAKLVADKVVVHLNLSLPMALARDVSHIFARQGLRAANKCCRPITDKEIDDKAKADLAAGIAKLIQNKWIQIRRDTILSTLDFKTGALFINGQKMNLPPSPSPSKDKGHELTYAEQIREKIRPHLFVPEGIPKTATVTFSVVQLPDGTILKATLKSSSGYATYDQATEHAILASSPLPAAPTPAQFAREITLTFKP